jgi:hypothetical protein
MDDTSSPKDAPEINWFNALYGFEETVENCHQYLSIVTEDDQIPKLKSAYSDKKYRIGHFHTPTIEELRQEAILLLGPRKRDIESRNGSEYKDIDGLCDFGVHTLCIGDVLELHHKYPKSTFQVASQMNCLEFSSPLSTPEDGITDYMYDCTQGPSCAIACSSGTVYRNYFAIPPTSRASQFNLLDELEIHLDNATNQYWTVCNGYMNSTPEALARLNAVIASSDKDEFIQKIKVGCHEDVGVVFSARGQPMDDALDVYVTQVYCSAVSCNYTSISKDLWQPLAEIILQAQYEGTIWTATLNYLRGGTNKLFMTFLGGGAFGNKEEWIEKGMRRALHIAEEYQTGLDIKICHFKGSTV